MTTATAESTLEPGTLVDQFRIVRLHGRGGMGEVYLARDTRLGRKVALKVVRPEALGERQAVERFFFEARVTAKFSHPHIVAIFGIGELRGCPYVALEFLEGQTLRERLNESRPGVKETLRIGQAIAEALKEAHQNQVTHRDLKPENVLIPKDGRLRVLDFGLAKAVKGGGVELAQTMSSGPEVQQETSSASAALSTATASPEGFKTLGGGVRGTPLYMAPEQWLEQECTSAADVWALGVILYELLSGRRPFEAPTLFALAARVCSAHEAPAMETVEPLPHELAALVARCLRKEPAERPTSAAAVEVIADLLLRDRGHREAEESPFRGLLSFTERQADCFFGRDTEVSAFIERIRDEPVLAVVGPSGAGKSSFVQAGVIPRLKEQARWLVLQVRPGAHPFASLASQLLHPESSGSMGSSPRGGATRTSPPLPRSLDPQDEPTLAASLTETPGRLSLLLHQLAEQAGAPVLLFVDQLEELLTHTEDRALRNAFLEAIGLAADDPREPIRVIFTLRDDFLGKAAESEAARLALSRVTVLRSPGPEALLEILTRSLASTGYRYEDEDLPREMVQAVKGEATSLPLLQFACSQLWEERDRQAQVLRRTVYVEMGGVEGAMARHADGVLQGLSTPQLGTAREVFLRLVTAEGTRRVATREALLQGLAADASEVIDRLIQERIVVTRKGRGTEGSEVELVHESLILRWDRLRRWLEEGREDLVFLAEVGQAATLWEKRHHPASEVWQGAALADALHQARRIASVPPLVHRFLQAGQAGQLRGRRIRRAVLSGAGLVLTVFAVVMFVLFRRADSARLTTVKAKQHLERANRAAMAATALAEDRERDAQQKLALGLVEKAETAITERDYLSARLYAAAALLHSPFNPYGPHRYLDGKRLDDPAGHLSVVRSYSALRRAEEFSYLELEETLHEGGASDVEFSPDGRHLAFVDERGNLYLYERRTRRLARLAVVPEILSSLAFSPTDNLLAAISYSGKLHLFDTKGQRLRESIELGGEPSRWVFTPDGRAIAMTVAGEVRVRQLASRSEFVLKRTGTEFRTLAVSSDSKTLAATGPGAAKMDVHLFDLPSRGWMGQLSGHHRGIDRLVFQRDPRGLISGSIDRTIRIWDTVDKKEVGLLLGHTGRVRRLSLSPDGTTLVSGSEDRTIRIWALLYRAPIAVLSAATRGARAASFSPDGGHVVTSWGSAVRKWKIVPPRNTRILRGHRENVGAAAFSPDRKVLASGGGDAAINLWDAVTGDPLGLLGKQRGSVHSVAFSPDGQVLASAGDDSHIDLWDTGKKLRLGVLVGHAMPVEHLRFSPDGRVLVSGDYQSVRVWDVPARRVLYATSMEPGSPGRLHASYSPTGRQFAVKRSQRYDIIDASTFVTVRSQRVSAGSIWGIQYSAKGDLLALLTRDAIEIRSANSGDLIATLPSPGAWRVRFSPDDRHLLVADDRTATLWDLEKQRPIFTFRATGSVRLVAFSPDGRRFAVNDGIDLWVLPLDFEFWKQDPAVLLRAAERAAGLRLDGMTLRPEPAAPKRQPDRSTGARP